MWLLHTRDCVPNGAFYCLILGPLFWKRLDLYYTHEALAVHKAPLLWILPPHPRPLILQMPPTLRLSNTRTALAVFSSVTRGAHLISMNNACSWYGGTLLLL